MKRELFQLGPEALKFKRVSAPIVDRTAAIIAAHNARVAEIEAAFSKALEEARDHAEWCYRQACDDAEADLSDAMLDARAAQ